MKRASSLRKQTSKPELSKTKPLGKTGPSKTGGKSERKKKDEKEAESNSSSAKTPPGVPKPTPELSQPVKKKSLGRSEVKKVPPPVAPKPGQRRLNLSLPPHLNQPSSKSKVKPGGGWWVVVGGGMRRLP